MTCRLFAGSRRACGVGVLLCLVLSRAAVSASWGQTVLGPPDTSEEVAGEAATARALGLSPSAPANDPLARLGPFAFRPRADFRTTYTDALQLSVGRAVPTYLDTYSTGLLVDIGNNWRADYAAAWTRYSHDGFRDSVNHALSLDGRVFGPIWTLSLSQRYTSSNSVMVETSRQTRTQNVSSQASAGRQLGQNMTVSVVAHQDLSFVEALADTYNWGVRPELTYRLASDLRAGIGVGSGYVLVYRATDMTYVRPLLHATWTPTQKTGINVSVGTDRWRFVTGNRPDRTGLFYSATARYQPFAQTTLTVTAARNMAAAPFNDQISHTRKWSVSVRQRLLRHWHLDLSSERQDTSNFGPALLSLARTDSLTSYNARLSVRFLRRISASWSYGHTQNHSSLPGYSFGGDQFGFQVGIRY